MSTGRERDERKLARIYGKRDRALRLLRDADSIVGFDIVYADDRRRAKRIRRLLREHVRELQVRGARFQAALASGKTMKEIDE